MKASVGENNEILNFNIETESGTSVKPVREQKISYEKIKAVFEKYGWDSTELSSLELSTSNDDPIKNFMFKYDFNNDKELSLSELILGIILTHKRSNYEVYFKK